MADFAITITKRRSGQVYIDKDDLYDMYVISLGTTENNATIKGVIKWPKDHASTLANNDTLTITLA